MKFPTPRRFVPKNPQKYIGDVNNIVCRSGLELKYFKYFDENPSIIKYSSEEMHIKYYLELDNKIHKYYPDFIIKVKNREGKINTIMIEIKPYSQTLRPTKGNKRNLTYINEVMTWEKNQAKWKYAEAFCKEHGMEFMVMTEREIKHNWNKK